MHIKNQSEVEKYLNKVEPPKNNLPPKDWPTIILAALILGEIFLGVEILSVRDLAMRSAELSLSLGNLQISTENLNTQKAKAENEFKNIAPAVFKFSEKSFVKKLPQKKIEK